MARYPHAIVLNCLKALSVDGISPKYLILDSLILPGLLLRNPLLIALYFYGFDNSPDMGGF